MNYKQIIAALLITFQMVGVPSASAEETPLAEDETLRALAEEKAEEIVEESVYDNLAALAGPACSIYALGIDLINFFYDGEWSIADSLIEITVLFRNSSWRELIWAISDQREAFLKEMTQFKKTKCVIGFSEAELRLKDDVGGLERVQQQQFQLYRQISALQGKIDYFGIQRRNMIFDHPKFGNAEDFNPLSYPLPNIEVDKIFYFIFSPEFLFDTDQLVRDAEQFGRRTYKDLGVVLDNIPDTCFAVVNVGHELLEYFAYAFHLEGGRYSDDLGREYSSFKEFVENNAAAIAKSYNDTYCKIAEKVTLPEPPSTSVEEQFELFLNSLNLTIEIVGTRLSEVEKELLQAERKLLDGQTLTPEEEASYQEFLNMRGTYLGMIDYYSLVISKVGDPTSKSLTKLRERLSSFVEAVLGVVKDDEERASSRISLSERFQKRKEKKLQEICARIETMYRQAGRSTADLPEIGSANGVTYCKARPDCADVNLGNFVGGSEGLKKLAECSGFLFDSSELGPSQATEDVIQAVGEDIGFLLEQGALNELLKARNLHFASLRNRYNEIYGAQTATTAALENILTNVSKDLFNKDLARIYDPESQDEKNGKTHYSILRKIYQDLWQFMDQQEGICLAPEEPKE